MRNHLKIAVLACVLVPPLIVSVPQAEAGTSFGIHIGGAGFGLSVGIGDWGPYTNNWANPQWSLDIHSGLSGYGEWVCVGHLGKVWRPWVATSWRPYTYGRWVRTTLGWTWVAYEPWGYIPHHYGSWAMCDFGWVWVPGYSYSSANVVWVRTGGYVGWYARPPHGWSHAARGYRHGYRDGYRDGWNDARYATYVDWHHLGSENVAHHAVHHSVASGGRVHYHGAPPSASEVRRRGGVPLAETRISQRTATMNGRTVTVARPEGVTGSIERHAARTAAAALSPSALERRQPLVRTTEASATRRNSRSDGGSRVEGQTVSAARTESSRRAAAIENPAGGRAASRLGTSPSASNGRNLTRMPSDRGRSSARSNSAVSSGNGRSSSSSTLSTSNRSSTRMPRTTGSASPQRNEYRGSSRSTPAAKKPSVVRSGSRPTAPTVRRAGVASIARPATRRTRTESATDGKAETGARRRENPRESRQSESPEKPQRRTRR